MFCIIWTYNHLYHNNYWLVMIKMIMGLYWFLMGNNALKTLWWVTIISLFDTFFSFLLTPISFTHNHVLSILMLIYKRCFPFGFLSISLNLSLTLGKIRIYYVFTFDVSVHALTSYQRVLLRSTCYGFFGNDHCTYLATYLDILLHCKFFLFKIVGYKIVHVATYCYKIAPIVAYCDCTCSHLLLRNYTCSRFLWDCTWSLAVKLHL